MKTSRCLAVLLSVCCTGGISAESRPYQLCQFEPNLRESIAYNYRYPPGRARRGPDSWDRYRCDASVDAVMGDAPGCAWTYERDCGYLDRPGDMCGDGEGWWHVFSVGREGHWIVAPPGPEGIVTWPPNPAVEVQRLQRAYREDHYRGWFWDSRANWYDFLGTIEGTTRTGNYPVCHTMAYLVGFFNGVWNTRREAFESLKEIEKGDLLGPTWRGAPVRYELYYNQTCKRSASDVCLQDIAEVFRQRSAELDGLLARRWEYFWDQVSGRQAHNDSLTQGLLARMSAGGPALAGWFGALGQATLAKITALSAALIDNPPTAQDMAVHAAQLIRAGQRAERAVLVAHSQGNLFANAAYDAYLAHSRQTGAAAGEDTGYVAAQVVHIAPASPTLRGPYVLVGSDRIIEALRRVDGTWLPVSNVPSGADGIDPSGHKLIDSYLHEGSSLRAQIRQALTQALDAL